MNIGAINDGGQAPPPSGQPSPEISAIDKKIRETNKQIGELQADKNMEPSRKADMLARLQKRLTELRQEKEQLLSEARRTTPKPSGNLDEELVKELAKQQRPEEAKKGTGTGRMEPGQFLDDRA